MEAPRELDDNLTFEEHKEDCANSQWKIKSAGNGCFIVDVKLNPQAMDVS